MWNIVTNFDMLLKLKAIQFDGLLCCHPCNCYYNFLCKSKQDIKFYKTLILLHF